LQKEAAKERQKSYMNSLNKQMEEQSLKKKYDTLMTEHERRVNDKDIKAYEVMDTVNLHGKLPGFKGAEQNLQERYVNKIFSTNTL
jgi:hypothetical protein